MDSAVQNFDAANESWSRIGYYNSSSDSVVMESSPVWSSESSVRPWGQAQVQPTDRGHTTIAIATPTETQRHRCTLREATDRGHIDTRTNRHRHTNTQIDTQRHRHIDAQMHTPWGQA